MAIAFDAYATGSATSTSLTYSHTCSGLDRMLFVLAADGSGSNHITGVTYNGVSMTRVNGIANAGAAYINLYYLVNPASGANNVVISSSTSVSLGGNSASYNGVVQSTLVDNSTTNGPGGTPSVTSLTTKASNCWTILIASSSSQVLAAGAGSTIHGTPTGFNLFDSNGAVSGSTSMTVTATASNIATVMASFAPDTTPSYWVGGNANWDASTIANWASTSGGSGGTAGIPTSGTNTFFDANSGANTATITATANCNSLNCTGFTGTIAGSSALNVYGSMTLVGGMTFSYSGTLSFLSTSSGNTITTAGKSIPATVFNGEGGAWTFNDNWSTTSITLTTGSVSLGSNTITLTGTGTVWSAVSGITLTAGTSTIKITDASSSGKTFSGGGLTYNNLWITGSGTGAYTIVGSNTFADFKVDTPPHTVNFTAGSHTAVATFTVSGTAGNLMTLQSTSSGSKWYIAHTTGNVTVCDYLSIQDCTAL